MRLHISLDDQLVSELDGRLGARERGEFIERAIRNALNELLRADSLERALGSIADSGHEWDADPVGWVRAQRAERASG